MEKIYNGTGRRKSSVARVFIKSGDGQITVNGRKPEDFFPRKIYLEQVKEPLMAVEMTDKVDIKCFVKGGGNTGQSGAVRLGLSRALLQMNPDFKPALRGKKLLTRDPREVERKKYGQKGARGRFQYSKR